MKIERHAIERLFDVGLGLSAIAWGVLGITHAEKRTFAVRVAIAGLNVAAGVLFLARRAAIAHGSVLAVLAALPSMIVGGAAVRLADAAAWPWPLEALFALGAAGSAITLASLGRSFAFLPSRRGLVEHGPYALVRHPAYACELAMVLACAIARPWPVAPLALAALIAIVVRIEAEERVLASDPAHARYRERVRWRLVPFLF